MKAIRDKTIQTLVFVWASVFVLRFAVSFMRRMMIAIASSEYIQIEIWPILTVMITYFTTSIIWIIKSKKKYKGDNFLKSEVVILDEDERGLLIHYKSSQEALRWVQAFAIGIVTYTIAMKHFDIKVESLMVAIAFIYTVYCIVYYYKLKKMYYE